MDPSVIQYGGKAIGLPKMMMMAVVLAVLIFEVFGLYYITQLVFGDSGCVMSPTVAFVVRATIVLVWLGILFKVATSMGLIVMM